MKEKVVKINGFKQNSIVLRNVPRSTVSEEKKNKTQEKYSVLEKQMLENGYVEIVVDKDYPINSDSITSMAEGADYKNDPMQAIANERPRVNLGDITQAQEFLQNPQNAKRIFEQTKMRLAQYYAQQRELNNEKQDESSTTQKESE